MSQSLRPFTADELARVLTETCTCGHGRVLHADTVHGMCLGHGACVAVYCTCNKFTWTPKD